MGDNANTIWGKLKNQITQAITTAYPQQKKKPKNEPPEWTQQAKQWSKEDEWETVQKHLTQRNKLQGKIEQIDQKTKQTEKHLTLLRTINAWKQATEYTKKRRRKIIYAQTPEPQEIEKH